MSIFFVAPGAPMAVAGQGNAGLVRALGAPLAQVGAVSTNNFLGPVPSDIPGLSGWWDAGMLGAILDHAGNRLASWNATVGALADKSSMAVPPLVPFHLAVDFNPNPTLAVPRINGFLGALGSPDLTVAQYAPTLDPDWGLVAPSLDFGSGSGWTLYFVWTRPNIRQGTIQVNTSPIPLIHLVSSGATLLQADSIGSGRLTLFPNSTSATVITTSLERRHTHAVILTNIPGSGMDVWLDGVNIAKGVTNPLPLNNPGQVIFLHDGTVQGSAQCWFHEAAFWKKPLNSSEILTLIACEGRWKLGARRGVNILVMGQSNAEWFTNSGGAMALSQGVAWYLGAAAWTFTAQQSGSYNSPIRYSMVSGHPISNSSPPLFAPGSANGTFLTNPGDGSSPSTWELGLDGLALQSYLTGAQNLVSAADEADIAFLCWPWSEQDSTMPYSSKSLYKGTVLQLLAKTRSFLNRSSAQLPVLVWNAIPYQTQAGVQMVRESIADLAADAQNNIVMFAPQTADSNPLGANWNIQTGLYSGGDAMHRDQPDLLRYGRLGCHAAAHAALAMGLSDTIPAQLVPVAGLPVAGGPQIIHAYQQGPTQIVVTVKHDAGTDLVVPLQAANGAGFVVMDGGSVANPGPIIQAIQANRVDSTHIELILSSAPLSAASLCFLFYPYGSNEIGRGNAVTDNLSTITPPASWNIGFDLGSAWNFNMPLQATSYAVPLSSTQN
jgi:hypothetical protein